MAEFSLNEEQRDLVERIGVLHDRLGLSPAPGRIIGLLIVSPRPELSFDEIREALGLSKSSTSAALNLLLSVGSVDYRTHPGERKRYFSKSYRNWEAALIARMDQFLSLRELLREAHALHEGAPERARPELPRMIDFLAFLEETIHDAYGRWSRERDAAEAEGAEIPSPDSKPRQSESPEP